MLQAEGNEFSFTLLAMCEAVQSVDLQVKRCLVVLLYFNGTQDLPAAMCRCCLFDRRLRLHGLGELLHYTT